jgi:hypothetical protein
MCDLDTDYRRNSFGLLQGAIQNSHREAEKNSEVFLTEFAKSEVLTIITRSAVVWYVTPCSLADFSYIWRNFSPSILKMEDSMLLRNVWKNLLDYKVSHSKNTNRKSGCYEWYSKRDNLRIEVGCVIAHVKLRKSGINFDRGKQSPNKISKSVYCGYYTQKLQNKSPLFP